MAGLRDTAWLPRRRADVIRDFITAALDEVCGVPVLSSFVFTTSDHAKTDKHGNPEPLDISKAPLGLWCRRTDNPNTVLAFETRVKINTVRARAAASVLVLVFVNCGSRPRRCFRVGSFSIRQLRLASAPLLPCRFVLYSSLRDLRTIEFVATRATACLASAQARGLLLRRRRRVERQPEERHAARERAAEPRAALEKSHGQAVVRPPRQEPSSPRTGPSRLRHPVRPPRSRRYAA